ncbi:hypothetical protein SDC9_116502 [bioreactor metagenome]|uniref:Uncharacterized protein n=1 Tax=bioreactor metagenome TaxID=1076179 RepID=A0A645BWD0_9ZZZZ
MMLGSIKGTLLGGLLGLEDHFQNSAHGFIQNLFIQFARTNGIDHLLYEQVMLARHFQIQPTFEGGHTVAYSAPIGNHKAFKAPIVLEDLRQQMIILRGKSTVHLVVGAHYGIRLAHFHGFFKSG